MGEVRRAQGRVGAKGKDPHSPLCHRNPVRKRPVMEGEAQKDIETWGKGKVVALLVLAGKT